MWQIISFIFGLPWVANLLINQAIKTPDEHLPGYMNRYWLINPYNRTTRKPKYSWLPFSARVHHILREDIGRHHHDHPWNARTMILRGWYIERRLHVEGERNHFRSTGDTASVLFGQYHTIDLVSPGGVWTLFIMGRYRGRWGFLVNGEKIDYQDYLG